MLGEKVSKSSAAEFHGEWTEVMRQDGIMKTGMDDSFYI